MITDRTIRTFLNLDKTSLVILISASKTKYSQQLSAFLIVELKKDYMRSDNSSTNFILIVSIDGT